MCQCTNCHAAFPAEQLTVFDELPYCTRCLASETFVCESCSERFLRSEDYGSGGFHVCQDCYDDYCTTCARCGHVIYRDDANYSGGDPYCDFCYSEYVVSDGRK